MNAYDNLLTLIKHAEVEMNETLKFYKVTLQDNVDEARANAISIMENEKIRVLGAITFEHVYMKTIDHDEARVLSDKIIKIFYKKFPKAFEEIH